MPSTFSRLLCLIPLLCLASSLHAQADKYSLYQLSGNYSWLSNSIDGVPGAHQPLNGWEAAFAALRWHGLRFKLDVSGYQGTNQGAPSIPSSSWPAASPTASSAGKPASSKVCSAPAA